MKFLSLPVGCSIGAARALAMSGHMADKEVRGTSTGYIPTALAMPLELSGSRHQRNGLPKRTVSNKLS
jgi:hypothetical protein